MFIMNTASLALLTVILFPRHEVPEHVVEIILKFVPGSRNVRQIRVWGFIKGTEQSSIQKYLTTRVGEEDIACHIMSYMHIVPLPRIMLQDIEYTGNVICGGYVYTEAEWNEYDYNEGYGCGVPCCHCGTSFEKEKIRRLLSDPEITFRWNKSIIPENFKCSTLKLFRRFLKSKMVCEQSYSSVNNSRFAGDCLYAFEVKIVTADTCVYTYLSHSLNVTKKTIVSLIIMLDISPHEELRSFCKNWV